MSYDYTDLIVAAAGIWLFVMLIVLAFAVVCYVFTSLGLYTIAKRRGIPAYGLAWVPVANYWIIGSIADNYDLSTKGLQKKQRVLLLALGIAYAVATIVFTVISTVWAIQAGIYDYSVTPASAIILLIGSFIVSALSIVLLVFMYISYYKIYKSCDPSKAVVFTVLSIIFNVTLPFFIFAVRNKDLGLYPPAPPPGFGPYSGYGGQQSYSYQNPGQQY